MQGGSARKGVPFFRLELYKKDRDFTTELKYRKGRRETHLATYLVNI